MGAEHRRRSYWRGVEEGVVTLSGHVESYSQKSAAEAASLRVRGVRGVADEIEVRLPKSWSTSDDEIATRALDAIRWDVRIPNEWIRPVVEGGLVTLKGEVDWQYQRVCVRHITGVTDVYNDGAGECFFQRPSDRC